MGRSSSVRFALVGAVAFLASCSSSSPAAESGAAARAETLVAAAQAAGVAQDLTPEVAASLYGTAAPQLCDVLAGGVGSAESVLLTGMTAGRRDKVITSDTVTFERLVVQTYCPDELSTYDALVADLDPVETTG